MRRVLAYIVLLTVIFCGCGMNSNEIQNSTTVSNHDHHAPQTRNRRLFFTEENRNEGVEYYLSYNEPDGCITRVGRLCTNQEEPELFYHDGCFYYFDGYYDTNRQESNGTLMRMDFSGQTLRLPEDGDVRPSAIIRVDDTGVYCEAEDGISYIRAELDLSLYTVISRDEAIGQ